MRFIKKLLCVVFTLCLLVCDLSVVSATVNSNQVDVLYIKSDSQWNSFAKRVQNGERFTGKTVKLCCDINVNGDKKIEPAGRRWRSVKDRYFDGTFDGGNHTIRFNASEASELSYFGLFPHIGAGGVVENLIVSDSSVEGVYCAVLCGINYGTIRNCIVSNSQATGSTACGGFCFENSGTIEWCGIEDTVVTSKNGNCGGLTCGNYLNINNCYALDCSLYGNAVLVSSHFRIGGLAACDKNYNATVDSKNRYGSFRNSYAKVQISTSCERGVNEHWKNGQGVLVGIAYTANIKDCYYVYDLPGLEGIKAFFGPEGKAENLIPIESDYLSDSELVSELNRKKDSSYLKWVSDGSAPHFARLNNVIVSKIKNGYYTVSNDKQLKDKKVVLQLHPNKNYKANKVTVKTVSGKKVKLTKVNKSSTKYSFVMPDEDVKVEVSYKKK